MAARAFAPAKVNLALHVTGLRDDGYHLLDSIVVFADVGDEVAVEPADAWSLDINGPFAGGLSVTDNLCLRAARLTDGAPSTLTLTKRLPVASGIGGGSADAAATLRALHAMDGRPVPEDLSTLGADVPVCLADRPARMRGIGERLSPLPALPAAYLCFVNPGVPVATPDVFSALTAKENSPLSEPLDWANFDAFIEWLSSTQNDLQIPAMSIAPDIGRALNSISETHGCQIARMSGSGATCFGIYATREEADSAAARLARLHPGWWIAPAAIRG